MKKYYLIVLTLFLFQIANAQIVNIPDTNFKAKLLSANESNGIAINALGNSFVLDENNDSEIQLSEAQKVYRLYVQQANISVITGIQSFSNLLELNCSDNQITTLDFSGNTTIQRLYCNNNIISSINVSGCTNLIQMHFNYNQVGTIDLSNLPNLQQLLGYHNQLSLINFSGTIHIQDLEIGSNQLTSIDLSSFSELGLLNLDNNLLTNITFPSTETLNNIHCSNNQLATLNLPDLPNLQYLWCDYNQITSLNLSSLTSLGDFKGNNNELTSITLPHSYFVNFDCSNNYITSLDLSPAIGFYQFYCSFNLLTALNLPAIPFGEFRCNNNQLTEINVPAAASLEYLDCSYNSLAALNIVPKESVGSLYCSHNQFTDLNLSAYTNLGDLFCSNNFLSTLDVSNLSDLVTLDCSYNDLHSLFIKNNNFWLGENVVFEENLNLQYICVNESQIDMINDRLSQYGLTSCEVNSYCSYTPGAFYHIRGRQLYDADNNGCSNADLRYPNLKFSITNGLVNGTIISDDSGYYDIPVQAGMHTIVPFFENPYFTAYPPSVTVTFPEQPAPLNQDFCVSANGVHPDVEIFLFNMNTAQPGFDTKYRIVFKNKGTTAAAGTIDFSFNEAIMDFIGAVPLPSTQASGTISWDYSALQPFESRIIDFTLNLNSPVETPPVIQGDLLQFSAGITLTSDGMPSDNTTTLHQRVFNAFDPNDKTCLEGETITPAMVGGYVHYRIRFENTGNYHAAIVTIKDVIDTSKFDIATLTPISGSHPFITRITNGNEVEFVFDNINLPFDDANNDGYLVFKIKTKPTLQLGDQLSNTAGIYFNYNAPVITNTAVTTVAIPLATNPLDNVTGFALYPNPVTDKLNISSKSNVDIDSVAVYNVLGQEVIRVLPAQGITSIEVSGLPSGNYVVKVATASSNWVSKFVKE
ncbi:MAG: internalin [Flavobacterium sp. BFFFF1]|uniref:DUF7619 domain-containing protein n=1 Tax=Flavobacterium sp. BFFFF1 TaxID=2015557 RepID=UPI000BD9F080|nr:T9SS type A sorting domain-containing protein [Flavobacterium sp. BFFFF1]OYU81271.1 MAG: internalin [Flavobacterium sp. BFFFF1]